MMKTLALAKILNSLNKFEKIRLVKKQYKDWQDKKISFVWIDSNDNELFESTFDSMYDAKIYLMQNFKVENGELKASWAHL